jgi:hypothetical protein
MQLVDTAVWKKLHFGNLCGYVATGSGIDKQESKIIAITSGPGNRIRNTGTVKVNAFTYDGFFLDTPSPRFA